MQIPAAMLSLVFGQPRGKRGKGFGGVDHVRIVILHFNQDR